MEITVYTKRCCIIYNDRPIHQTSGGYLMFGLQQWVNGSYWPYCKRWDVRTPTPPTHNPFPKKRNYSKIMVINQYATTTELQVLDNRPNKSVNINVQVTIKHENMYRQIKYKTVLKYLLNPS